METNGQGGRERDREGGREGERERKEREGEMGVCPVPGPKWVFVLGKGTL